MRRVDLTLEPTGSFDVPESNGYQVYGALLAALDDVDEDVSQQVHDSDLGSLHNSGLQGRFTGSDRPHHQQVRQDETYSLRLGVTDPSDQSVFQALANAFVFDGDTLELSEGDFRVRDFASTNTTHEELLSEAAKVVDNNPANFEITIEFETPTCIREADEITTMFAHRGSVFRSLLRKWNKTVPEKYADELELGMTRSDFEENLIEKPRFSTFDTHSILVNRGENGGPILRQGFTGRCTYKFKGASEAVRTATTALALFCEYGGIGGFVARGCGSVSTEVQP